MHYLYLFMAFLVGASAPFQSAINSQLGQRLSNPYQATFINFLVGLIFIFFCLALTPLGLPDWKKLSGQPPYLFMGGLLGAAFVFSGIFFLPKIGALSFFAWMVAGQLAMSLALDHYGFLGVAHYPITFSRVLGLVFLFSGVVLVLKR